MNLENARMTYIVKRREYYSELCKQLNAYICLYSIFGDISTRLVANII